MADLHTCSRQLDGVVVDSHSKKRKKKKKDKAVVKEDSIENSVVKARTEIPDGVGLKVGNGELEILVPFQDEKNVKELECSENTNTSSQPVHVMASKKKRKKKKGYIADSSLSGSSCTKTSSTETDSKHVSTFDKELEWCIAQLKLSMLRPGAKRVQKNHSEQNLQVLKSIKTPLPKKRQLMRSLFGDYRTKMRTQPIPDSFVFKETKVKAEKAESTIETLGTYFRKASTGTGKRLLTQDESSFRFNFTIPADNDCGCG